MWKKTYWQGRTRKKTHFPARRTKPFPFHTRKSVRNYMANRKSETLTLFSASSATILAEDHDESNYFRNGNHRFYFHFVHQFSLDMKKKVVQAATPHRSSDWNECVLDVDNDAGSRWQVPQVSRKWRLDHLWKFFFSSSPLLLVFHLSSLTHSSLAVSYISSRFISFGTWHKILCGKCQTIWTDRRRNSFHSKFRSRCVAAAVVVLVVLLRYFSGFVTSIFRLHAREQYTTRTQPREVTAAQPIGIYFRLQFFIISLR